MYSCQYKLKEKQGKHVGLAPELMNEPSFVSNRAFVQSNNIQSQDRRKIDGSQEQFLGNASTIPLSPRQKNQLKQKTMTELSFTLSDILISFDQTQATSFHSVSPLGKKGKTVFVVRKIQMLKIFKANCCLQTGREESEETSLVHQTGI